MIGQRFNRLVVLERVSKVGEKSIKYRCVCDCGNETIARKDHLINGAKTSCGCALYRAKENAEEFKAKYPQYIFLDEPDSYSKPIRVKCKKCGGIRETSRHQLQNGNQCPICCNQVICDGVNDIKTVAPWMLEYFVNESDAKRYSVKSDRKVQMKCPICGAEKYMVISKLYNRGFSCNCCGRNTSYPNRYIRAVLRQLPVENLTFEYSPNWIESKIFYDNYFTYKDKQYFVEADGIQHYSSRNNWNRNGEVNKKDELKDNLAKEHGIQMIRIDCQESSASYIKNTVRESQLADVFDLSIIDWEQCAKEAASNNIRDIAEYFNKVTQKPKQVAEHFKISKKVVYRKLREATECGLCKYEGRKKRGTLC